MSLGKHNSSKTRVLPFFRTLLRRDPEGSTRLPTLLALAPLKKSYPQPDLLAHPGLIREFRPNLTTDTEKKLAPPEAFLRWLIQHPESMTWPRKKNGRVVFGTDTQHWRERLMAYRELTGEPHERRSEIREADRRDSIDKALTELSRLGARGSDGRWWAFEGFTCVDFYIRPDFVRIYVEGKRTEALTPKITWYPKRNQLVRNIESAKIDAADVTFACLVIGEKPLTDIDLTTIDSGLPHLEPIERQAVMRHYLGAITWRQACAATDCEYASLPETV